MVAVTTELPHGGSLNTDNIGIPDIAGVVIKFILLVPGINFSDTANSTPIANYYSPVSSTRLVLGQNSLYKPVTHLYDIRYICDKNKTDNR